MRVNCSWTAAIVRVTSIWLIISDGCCTHERNSAHCDVTTLSDENSRVKLNVLKTNATAVREPHNIVSWLDVCLIHGYLRINWTIPQILTEGSDVKLCYDVKSLRDMETVQSRCFVMHVPRAKGHAHIYCWFKFERFKEKPYIEALATYSAKGQPHFFYGDVTVALKENCMDACSIPVVNFETSLISCIGVNHLRHDHGVRIERLVFKGDNSYICQDVLLNVTRKADVDIEYSMNCAYNGLGRIYYLYTFQGTYCHKYTTVRVVCETGTMPSTQAREPTADTQSHVMLMVVPVVIVLTISVAFVVFFVFKWRKPKRHRQAGRDGRIKTEVDIERESLNDCTASRNIFGGE